MQQEFLLTAILLTAMALLAGTALVLSYLLGRPKGSIRRFCIRRPRIRRPKGLIRRFWVDPRIEHEFNKVFMTTSKEGKQALIKRWTDRKKCDREEAMRLAIEELRRDNR